MIRLWVQPRAGSNAVCGLHGEALKIRITAPPVDNKANDAVVKMLAGLLRVSPSDLSIESGRAGRGKKVLVDKGAGPDWKKLNGVY